MKINEAKRARSIKKVDEYQGHNCPTPAPQCPPNDYIFVDTFPTQLGPQSVNPLPDPFGHICVGVGSTSHPGICGECHYTEDTIPYPALTCEQMVKDIRDLRLIVDEFIPQLKQLLLENHTSTYLPRYTSTDSLKAIGLNYQKECARMIEDQIQQAKLVVEQEQVELEIQAKEQAKTQEWIDQFVSKDKPAPIAWWTISGQHTSDPRPPYTYRKGVPEAVVVDVSCLCINPNKLSAEAWRTLSEQLRVISVAHYKKDGIWGGWRARSQEEMDKEIAWLNTRDL